MNICLDNPTISDDQGSDRGNFTLKVPVDPKCPVKYQLSLNFGLFPPLERVKGRKIKKKDRKPIKARQALEDLAQWMEEYPV